MELQCALKLIISLDFPSAAESLTPLECRRRRALSLAAYQCSTAIAIFPTKNVSADNVCGVVSGQEEDRSTHTSTHPDSISFDRSLPSTDTGF